MVFVATITLLVGCSSVQVRYPDGKTETKTRTEFEAYVEGVFRYHNRVLNDLIVASSMFEDDRAELDSRLIRAEEVMVKACGALNETVSAAMEGRDVGFFKKLQLAQTVPACEAASRSVETLLPLI